MSNRFNYRCPACGSPDEIEICAAVMVRLTSDGAEIVERGEVIGEQPWCSASAAGCAACGFEGTARDFEQSGNIVELFPKQGIRFTPVDPGDGSGGACDKGYLVQLRATAKD